MSNKKSLPKFALEVTSDVILGISLGILVDKLANIIAKYLNAGKIAKLFIQLLLIIIVLYLMKIDEGNLYASWQTEQGYGILFMALFLASQRNLLLLIEDVYGQE